MFIPLQQQKHGKAYDFIDSEYKAQDVTIFDDATSFGFQEFLNVFDRIILQKISSKIYKHGFLSYAIITKASSIKIGLID